MPAIHKTIHRFIAVFFILFAGSGWAHAVTMTGKVVGVSDGDTITVLDASKTQFKIRLEGIDAPEKAQPFGQKSKEHLSDLVFGRQVTVESNKTDKYDRTVGKVCSGQVISDSLIDFFDVDSLSKALGDRLPSFE